MNSNEFNNLEKPEFITAIKIQNKEVIIELKNYSIPYLDLISENVKEQVRNWTDWIDFWSIDFDYKPEIFNNMWISFRTPKDRELRLISSPFSYKNLGIYTVSVKIIDIMGAETIQNYDVSIK